VMVGNWWIGVRSLNGYDGGVPGVLPHHTAIRTVAVSPLMHTEWGVLMRTVFEWGSGLGDDGRSTQEPRFTNYSSDKRNPF
jgi:hypothetical protein